MAFVVSLLADDLLPSLEEEEFDDDIYLRRLDFFSGGVEEQCNADNLSICPIE